MVKISYTGKYTKDLAELLTKFPALKMDIDKRVSWFVKNPDDTRLFNHPLRKSMEGKWAFSLSDDVRIVYEWLGNNAARFLAIGSHIRVYTN